MKLLSVLFLSVFAIHSAQALPIHRKVDFAELETLFQASATANYNFEGIVQLSNCSGAIIRLENAKDTDKALVLSNGHCVEGLGGFIKPNTYVARKPMRRSFTILNADGSNKSGAVVRSTQIVYATMTGTDVSIYELENTYAEIENKFKTKAIMVESAHPVAKDAIQILSGYWHTGYACNIDSFVYQLKEDAYTWSDSLRYSKEGCHTIHGTSGSPIISANTHKVVGINNTGNDDGERCTMDNPCEVSTDGQVYFEKGISYGQQTYIFYTCLDQNGKIDATVPGCKLFH